jgi:hypothetical protein
MKVEILAGYGPDKETPDEQQEFLDWLKDLFKDCGLTIKSIASEEPTGGPITMEVDSDDPGEVTRVFLELATQQSQQQDCQMAFELEIDGVSIEVVGEY